MSGSPEINAPGVRVPALLAGVVQVRDTVVAFADDVVVGDHHARDGAEEDRVGGEVRRELVAALQQVPGEHDEPDDRGDVSSPADVL